MKSKLEEKRLITSNHFQFNNFRLFAEYTHTDGVNYFEFVSITFSLSPFSGKSKISKQVNFKISKF